MLRSCDLIHSLLAGVAIKTLLASVAWAQWSAPVNLTDTVQRFSVDTHMAIDLDGHVHIIYQDFLDSDGRNYYINNVGGTWSPRELIGTMSGKGSWPVILITPDHQLHVLYGRNTIFWRTRPLSGGSWSSPVAVAGPFANSGAFINHAAVDASGGIYFMYGRLFDPDIAPRNGVWGRYKPLAQPWGPTELIVGGGPDGNWHKGDHVVAQGNTFWAAYSWDGRTFYKKRPQDGTWPEGAGTLFHQGAGLKFAFDSTSNEVAAAFGRDIDGSCQGLWWEVFARFSPDGGETWGDPLNVSQTVGLDRIPDIAYDMSGNFHLVYQGAGCCDCTLRLRYISRINGQWNAPVVLSTPSGPFMAGATPGGLMTFGNSIYLTYSQAMGEPNFWDSLFRASIQEPPPPPEPPVLGTVTLSEPALFANDIRAHTLTLRASDMNGVNDLRTMRFLINYHGQHAGEYRGYVSWGQSHHDIGTFGGVESWAISPVDSGVGYWGMRMNGWGKDDYIRILRVDESTSGIERTVTFTFTVKPLYLADGPLTGNDISFLAQDGLHATGWHNYDLGFRVTVPGDFDGDHDVDLQDFGRLQACLTGSAVPHEPSCADANLDGDSDVDQDDMGILLSCLSGPRVAVDLSCAE